MFLDADRIDFDTCLRGPSTFRCQAEAWPHWCWPTMNCWVPLKNVSGWCSTFADCMKPQQRSWLMKSEPDDTTSVLPLCSTEVCKAVCTTRKKRFNAWVGCLCSLLLAILNSIFPYFSWKYTTLTASFCEYPLGFSKASKPQELASIS